MAGKFSLAEHIAKGVVPDLGTAPAGGREQIQYIGIDRLEDDPNNFYELAGIEELAANIELLGLQQPIRVRPGPEQGMYTIVSGHRRRAAARKLVEDGREDLRELPCIVEQGTGSAALHELRLIYANSDTRKLSPAEIGRQAERVEALLYQLKEEGYDFPGRMRDHVAEACKVSKSKLARLKVIRENLAGTWKMAYEKGKLSESAAYALAQMPAQRQQVLCDGLAQRGEAPSSVQEYSVKHYGEALAQAEAVECRTYGNGPCLNRGAMQERIIQGDRWGYNFCRQCCEQCPELARCKYACPLLADKVKQLKADAKAQRQQEQQAKEKWVRPQVAAIQRLWRRFGEARAAAGKSVQACRQAVGMSYTAADEETCRKLEGLEGKFSEQTTLPYGYGCRLSEVQRYVKLADLLGVSLDYLLCRTDSPANVPPQPEGQLVFNGWMPGGTTPSGPCEAVADFDLGDGASSRVVCRYDGGRFRYPNTGSAIDAKLVRWMALPPVEGTDERGEAE